MQRLRKFLSRDREPRSSRHTIAAGLATIPPRSMHMLGSTAQDPVLVVEQDNSIPSPLPIIDNHPQDDSISSHLPIVDHHVQVSSIPSQRQPQMVSHHVHSDESVPSHLPMVDHHVQGNSIPTPLPMTSQHPQGTSAMRRANNYARQGLNVLSPISGAIPVAGTPLKAAIDALMVVLNGFNTRTGNKKDVDSLVQRLFFIHHVVSELPPISPAAQYHVDVLSQKLDAISDRLKQMRVDSVLGSADIQQEILHIIREIDSHMLDYTTFAVVRIERGTQEGAARQLPASITQEIVCVRDPTGREFTLALDQCQSLNLITSVLRCYLAEENDRNKVVRDIMTRGAYDLYTETRTAVTCITEGSEWPIVGAGTKIIMSAIFEQARHKDRYQCPRPQCRAWNTSNGAQDGWIDCCRCPGRFQITNAKRVSGKRSGSGESERDAMKRGASDDLLDLVQIFHLRQQLQQGISRHEAFTWTPWTSPESGGEEGPF